MMTYEFGDVLLVKDFPYSGQKQFKKRPALVVADTADDDLVVARVTTESGRDDYDLVLERWKETGLFLPSTVRVSKIATLHKKLVLKKLGRIGSPEQRKVRTALRGLFGL